MSLILQVTLATLNINILVIQVSYFVNAEIQNIATVNGQHEQTRLNCFNSTFFCRDCDEMEYSEMYCICIQPYK